MPLIFHVIFPDPFSSIHHWSLIDCVSRLHFVCVLSYLVLKSSCSSAMHVTTECGPISPELQNLRNVCQWKAADTEWRPNPDRCSVLSFKCENSSWPQQHKHTGSCIHALTLHSKQFPILLISQFLFQHRVRYSVLFWIWDFIWDSDL